MSCIGGDAGGGSEYSRDKSPGVIVDGREGTGSAGGDVL